jgi:hypothetical protein
MNHPDGFPPFPKQPQRLTSEPVNEPPKGFNRDNMVAMAAIGDVLKFLYINKIDVLKDWSMFDEEGKADEEQCNLFMQQFLKWMQGRVTAGVGAPLPTPENQGH